MVIDQLRDFLEEGTVRNAVNFPAVEMPRESPHRVAIANANVPNMLGMISTTMARSSLKGAQGVERGQGGHHGDSDYLNARRRSYEFRTRFGATTLTKS